MKRIIVTVLVIISVLSVFSQGVVISESTSATPDASAILDVQSTDKGILIPRMSLLQRLDILTPAEGLMIYQINDVKGFYYYISGEWHHLYSSNEITDLGSGKIITDAERTKLNADNDASATNELQDLSLNGNVLSLTNDNTTVDLSKYIDDTEITNLGSGKIITDAERTKLNAALTTEVDGSTTNEIQDLSLNGNILSLTNDNSTVNLTNIKPNREIAVFEDRKPMSTVGGGAYTAGNWVDRELNSGDNTTNIQRIGNTIQLQPGTYLISGYTSAFKINFYQARLKNATLGTVAIYGTSEFSGTGGDYAQTNSNFEDKIIVTNTSIFQIQIRGSLTRINDDALGVGLPFGSLGEYFIITHIKIEKLD